MSDNVVTVKAERIRQLIDVVHQIWQKVIGLIRRAGARRIPPLIRGDGPIAGRSQGQHLCLELNGCLRKSMEKKNRRSASGSRNSHVEGKAIGCNLNHLDGWMRGGVIIVMTPRLMSIHRLACCIGRTGVAS